MEENNFSNKVYKFYFKLIKLKRIEILKKKIHNFYKEINRKFKSTLTSTVNFLGN